MTANIYVFYGVACSGKSTTALRCACERNIRTIVSTDYLREVQRIYVPSDQLPALAKVSHSAWELLGEPSQENIVRGFLAHAEAVWPAIDAVARKLARDGLDAIIEGTHFHGSLIDRLRQQDGAVISPALVAVRSAQELLDHISSKESKRSPGSEPKMWRANASVLLDIQEFLLADSVKFSIPVMRTGELPTSEGAERDEPTRRSIRS